MNWRIYTATDTNVFRWMAVDLCMSLINKKCKNTSSEFLSSLHDPRAGDMYLHNRSTSGSFWQSWQLL